MRNAALLMASLLLGSMALAGGKRATAQGPSEQFATAEAMRVIPKGATITDTTCRSIDVGISSRFVQQLPRHQRWRCGFGSASASLAGLRPGIGGGGNKAAG